ncbi:GNAT family N-acetyltransferase [Roseateles sp.]|uniref:GNAT family N-acetyltransferase n=1 Tax=Roseateles sp. TaxID=1971397 RepID=UPI0025E3D4CC|nr:GNAT family N-acetyltransferase [Roseateles sp.]
MQVEIRHAGAADVLALLELRNHYVANSFATFDEAPHTAEFIGIWVSSFNPEGPYQLLVAYANGELLGFCSSQPYRTHPAFRHTIETSVYVGPGGGGRGVGSALYAHLFRSLQSHRLHRAVVGIALPNEASVRLHEKFGYTKVGVFNEYAVKNGQYISSQWMERAL